MPNSNQYIVANQERFLNELMEFLRIPSVSTTKQHTQDITRAAEFVRDKLLAAGADQARVIETAGHPLVYGEKIVNERMPTVLVYGHYDVQPADPYALWHTPPFEPTIKEGKIYARGASDDKGQVYMHIKALETMVANQKLPCNIKFLIEGEEENGSTSLMQFLQDKQHHALLQADAILVSDTSLFSMEQPSLTIGLRGIVYLEVTVTGPNRDLHSGVYGGVVANPINVLCKMLGSLQDEYNHITIPGFYDKVELLSAAEKATISNIPFNLADYQAALGIEAVIGEQGYGTLEQVGTRPSLDINGIWGGYIEEGAKTVLPAQAHAKLSMRLVPHQEAQEIIRLFTEYFTSLAPKGVQVTVKPLHEGSNAIVINKQSAALQAAKNAFESVWSKQPLLLREGGSIPILTELKEALGCDIVMMGFGLNTDAVHSPNEHFGLTNFFKGMETVMAFYKHLATLSSHSPKQSNEFI